MRPNAPLIALTLCALAVFPVAAGAAEGRLDARISCGTAESPTKVTRVTVFRDRVLVTRAGTIAIPARESSIIVKHLPQRTRPESVRVSATGPAGAVLGGVEAHFDHVAPEAVKALTDAIEQADDRLREMTAEEEGLAVRLDLLKSVASLGGADTPDGKKAAISSQSLDAAAAFIESQTALIVKARTTIAVERRAVTKKKREAEEALARLTGGKGGRGLRVEVPVRSPSAGQFAVTVQYVVEGPSWKPDYDARWDEAAGKAVLSYYGTVTQSTGEDWRDCALTLSTAQPNLGAEPPELRPWPLRRPPPPRPAPLAAPRAKAAPGGAAPALMNRAAAPEDAGENASAQYAPAEASLSGETVVFAVPNPRNIPSDGDPHRVFIGALNLAARKHFRTAPRLDPRVYLAATCRNSSPYLLLPGRIAVFQGDEFTGTQTLREPVGFEQEFRLALGSVPTLKVERRRTKEFSERKGIVSQREAKVYAYEITLENNSPGPAEIEVLDQLPFSTDEDIRVEDAAFDPAPAERDKLFPGELLWRVEVEPKAKKTVRFQFTVTFPKDLAVEGL